MCDDKEFSSNNQIQHFGYHAYKVEEQISQLHRGISDVSIQSIMQHAAYATELADKGVPSECKQRLSQIAVGELILLPTLTMS